MHLIFLSIPRNPQQILVKNSSLPSCEKVLDNLDLQFNQRRVARQTSDEKKGVKSLFDLYEPEATCFSEERFGGLSSERFKAFGDGPKFVCGVDVVAAKAKAAEESKSDGCLVYSIGSNNDIRFEKATHTFMNGCEIHTFDPTLDENPFIGGEYATFHPWGLGTDGGKEGKTMHNRNNKGARKSFATVLNNLGHTGRTIDVLKIDCQGCEYAAMPPLFDMIAEGKVKVDQILIELHGPKKSEKNVDLLKKFFDAADKAKMRVTHKERNGWGCDGYRCVEYSLVSEEFLREANGAVMCPAYGHAIVDY